MLTIVMHRRRKFLHSLIHEPDRLHVTDWEAKLNPARAAHDHRRLLSCCLFLQVFWKVPRSVPSAYEFVHISYLVSPLKNWVLRVTVTHVYISKMESEDSVPLLWCYFIHSTT